MVHEVKGYYASGTSRSLVKIKQDLLREFQNPKSESQCITKSRRSSRRKEKPFWDYDQQFKILLDRLTFQIQDVQHREWFIAGFLPHIQVPLTQ
jgi:hypothetical protein